MPGSFPPWLPGIAYFRRVIAPTLEVRVDEVEDARCSARGCQRPAEFALRWNNPKLHPPERRKTWLACADHRASLTEFLAARGFMREVEPVPPAGLPAAAPPPASNPGL